MKIRAHTVSFNSLFARMPYTSPSRFPVHCSDVSETTAYLNIYISSEMGKMVHVLGTRVIISDRHRDREVNLARNLLDAPVSLMAELGPVGSIPNYHI